MVHSVEVAFLPGQPKHQRAAVPMLKKRLQPCARTAGTSALQPGLKHQADSNDACFAAVYSVGYVRLW